MITSVKQNERPLSKFEDFHDLLSNWDRAAFGVACRRMEVLILRGQNEKAVGVLRSVMRVQGRVKLSLQSHVVEAFPYRLANALDLAGYATVQACKGATDAELLDVDGIGSGAVATLRNIIRCIVNGSETLPVEDLSDLEPDWDFGQGVFTKGDLIVSKVEEALAVLMESGGAAVAEIDAKISRLGSEIDNLKRMRKILAPTVKNGSRTTLKGDYAELAKQVCELIKQNGPLKAREVAERLGSGNYTHIGRCVAACPSLLAKRSDGSITLAGLAG